MQTKSRCATAMTLLFALSSSAATGAPVVLEEVKPLKRDQWLSYRQPGYQLVDPAGDLILQPTQARVFVSECVSSPQAVDTFVTDRETN